MIDEELKNGQQSNLQQFFGHHPVHTFSDFSSSKFGDVNLALKNLKNDSYPMVIHTTLTGARGTNFALYKDAIVLCAFVPRSYADCVQALGRGCRNENGRGVGVLIVSHAHTDISESTILDLLADRSLGNELDENVRIQVMRKAHQKEFSMNEDDY